MANNKHAEHNIAIVLGSKSVNAVGLIRSLGQGGIPVTFASNYSKLESKWTKDYLRLPTDSDYWLPPLLEYISKCNLPPIIFPTDDASAFFLDANYDVLKDHCRFSHAKGQLRTLADKATMSELASSCGLTVPPYRKLSLNAGGTQISSFPVILKPFAAYAGSKGDIRICNTPEEYHQSIAYLRERGYSTVMAQEFIRAEGQYEIGLMGLSLPNGRVIIPATIHKLRSYPPERGSTSYAKVKNGIDTANETTLVRFVRKTGYIGLFDIEMIISKGIAYFIEINFRNGQYGYAPTVAGYNLPANWYNGILGQPVADSGTISDIYYMNERDDRLHVKEGRISNKQWKEEFRNTSAYGMYCSGDQRPYLRQYIKIPDRVLIKIRKLRDALSDLLVKEEWCVAYRINSTTKLYEQKQSTSDFRVLKNTFRYWAADPFVITVDDVQYIFFEMFDRFVGKGSIGYRTVRNGKVSRMRKIYETNTHLSFPYIFKHEGAYYMMPESAKSRELYLLKAISFPDRWERVHTFTTEKKICDSVFLQMNNDVFLLTQEIEGKYNFAALHCYLCKNGELIDFIDSPIVNDASNARMAGAIIADGDRLIRVAQDCSGEYGGAICFNEILAAPKNGYSEKILKRISINDIPCSNRKRFRGIHTYNTDGCSEVVDLKHQYRFHLGNVINLFYRLIIKFFS